MLRDAGVRTKLLAVLAIPTVLLVVLTALLVGGQVTAARRAGQVNALTDVAVQVNRVVHSLQEERSAHPGLPAGPEPPAPARMAGQRQFTDPQLPLRDDDRRLADRPHGRRRSGRRAPARPPPTPSCRSARKSIDAGRFFATEADVFYTKVIRADLDLPGVIASSAPPSWPSGCRPTPHSPARSSTPRTSATWSRSPCSTAPSPRQTSRSARPSSPSSVSRCRTSSGTRPACSSPAGRRARQVPGLRDRPGPPGTARPAQGPGLRRRRLGRRGSPPRTRGSRR